MRHIASEYKQGKEGQCDDEGVKVAVVSSSYAISNPGTLGVKKGREKRTWKSEMGFREEKDG